MKFNILFIILTLSLNAFPLHEFQNEDVISKSKIDDNFNELNSLMTANGRIPFNFVNISGSNISASDFNQNFQNVTRIPFTFQSGDIIEADTLNQNFMKFYSQIQKGINVEEDSFEFFDKDKIILGKATPDSIRIVVKSPFGELVTNSSINLSIPISEDITFEGGFSSISVSTDINGEAFFKLEGGQTIGEMKVVATSVNLPEVTYDVDVEVVDTLVSGSLGDLVLDGTNIYINGIASSPTVIDSRATFSGGVLTLPANQKYDFNNITMLTAATIVFKPMDNLGMVQKTVGWTELYSKGSCLIDGVIEAQDSLTDGNTKVIATKTIDLDDLERIIPSYRTGISGGSSPTAQRQTYQRTRSCTSSSDGKFVTWSCSSWTGHYVAITVADGAGNSGNAGSKLSGGAGGAGGRNGSIISGGAGGARGTDGNNVFIQCNNSISGSGIIDLAGKNGESGLSGTSPASPVNSGETCNATAGNGDCTRLYYYRYNSSPSGGGSGGNGGIGGWIVLKSDNINHSLSINNQRGLGGSAGLGATGSGIVGSSGAGSSGLSGIEDGSCLILAGTDNSLASCN
jgi:hypothetical protein